jgi:hypothetical protein
MLLAIESSLSSSVLRIKTSLTSRETVLKTCQKILLALPKPFDLFQDGGPVRHVVEPERPFLPVSQLFQPARLLPTLHSPPVLLPLLLLNGNIYMDEGTIKTQKP